MLPIRTILHPTDFSASSRSAREYARSLAADYGALLVVAHVATSKAFPDRSVERSVGKEFHLAGLEARLRKLFKDDFSTQVMIHVREGEAIRSILDVANEVHADLIVMGTNGLTLPARPMLGRVTEGVMRGAACPVFTVQDQASAPASSDARRPAAYA